MHKFRWCCNGNLLTYGGGDKASPPPHGSVPGCVGEELVHEVGLSTASDLSRPVNRRMPIRVSNNRFLHLEQSSVHGFLGGHIPRRAPLLDEVAVLAHPLEEALLSGVDAVAAQDFREVTDEDVGLRGFHGVGELDLGCVGLGLCFQLCALSLFLLEVGCELDDEVRISECLLDGFGGEVASTLADGRQDFACDSTLEGFGSWEFARHDQRVQA